MKCISVSGSKARLDCAMIAGSSKFGQRTLVNVSWSHEATQRIAGPTNK